MSLNADREVSVKFLFYKKTKKDEGGSQNIREDGEKEQKVVISCV